jgi:hypothetical protein
MSIDIGTAINPFDVPIGTANSSFFIINGNKFELCEGLALFTGGIDNTPVIVQTELAGAVTEKRIGGQPDLCNINYGEEWSTFKGTGFTCTIVPKPVSQFGMTNTPCMHVKASGDPLTCCLKDANQNPTDDNKTDGLNKLGFPNTCEFGFRNLASSSQNSEGTSCRSLVKEFCDPENSDFENRWFEGTQPCLKAFERIASSNGTGYSFSPDGAIPIPEPVDPQIITGNIDNRLFLQGQMNAMFSKLNLFANPDEIGSSNTVNRVFELCEKYPFACDMTKVCSAESSQSIINNIDKLRWCGCYLPEKEYERYPGISRECSTQCNREGVLPLVDINNLPKKCKGQDVCIIDDISINLNTGSGTNFKQVCGGCASEGANCVCLVSDDTFINSGDQDISQVCGSTRFLEKKSTGPQFILLYSIIIFIIIVIALFGYFLLRK